MTDEKAKETIVRYWLQKASRSLSSARTELEMGNPDFSVNRAYYAAFYAASAVLLQMGKRFVKHSGLRAAVHRDLIHEGKAPENVGEDFDALFASRQTADYVELAAFDAVQAEKLIQAAARFVGEMRKILRSIKKTPTT